MFELSVACKYLLPRWRQLSVSIISIISILVIALVVWLIVVFFSVTDGLEASWIRKLTALTAPVRITPTEAYYNSYYYQIDGLSSSSDFSTKTIAQKLQSTQADPYDPETDLELPSYWAEADRDPNGQVKDLVKSVYSSVNEIPLSGIKADDFELTMSHINLKIFRPADDFGFPQSATPSTESEMSYPAYLGNFSGSNTHLSHTLTAISAEDANNVLRLIANPFSSKKQLSKDTLHNRLNDFWQQVSVSALKSSRSGWLIPRSWLPQNAKWTVAAIFQGSDPVRLVVPQNASDIELLLKSLSEQGRNVKEAFLHMDNGLLSLQLPSKTALNLSDATPLILQSGTSFPASLVKESIDQASNVQDLEFDLEIPIQGALLKGRSPFRRLDLADIKLTGQNSTFWIYSEDGRYIIPTDFNGAEGVLLPKGFKDSGVYIGDRGTLSYLMPTASTVQEQQVPVYVAGFYDPGIIPIGGKYILANKDLVSMIRGSHSSDDKSAATNGINIHFDLLDRADEVKAKLIQSFKDKGIDRYWKVETFRDFEFTQGIMQELQSQKTIFTLISLVIILVACSNIISMLIILVNDKKVEIGILRSMGASSASIALIFGIAGSVIGLLSSILGVGAAMLTLEHLSTLMGWISHFQGHDLFQSALLGEKPPTELSYNALSFVLMATMAISLLAGIVPAVKACLLRPSEILRSGGG